MTCDTGPCKRIRHPLAERTPSQHDQPGRGVRKTHGSTAPRVHVRLADRRVGSRVMKIGRIPILDVSPSVDGGRWPSHAVVGETVTFSATVFREGHDAVNA